MKIVLVLALAAACGGNKAAPATSTISSEPAKKPGDEMKNLPPELSKFHDVLAPHWHAEKGPKRMGDTCAALADFHAEADAIAKATPPRTANADSWTTGTKALVASVNGLDAPCKANDAAGFETAFQKVHDSFHVLLDMGGGEGQHMEEGEHAM